MTTADIRILTPPTTATERAQPATARHRDDTRPVKYGPHLTRRAAALGRVLDRASLARAWRTIDDTEDDTR